MSWGRRGVGSGLPVSNYGIMPSPPAKISYQEATLLNGRRGRVVEDMGETVRVELYATGECETISKHEVILSTRRQ